jgi:multidrug resistance efflux pump
MEAIVEMKDKPINQGENVSTITLKDHEDKVNALSADIALKDKAIDAAGTQIKSLKEMNEQLNAEVKALKEATEKSEREARNQKLFSENKINAAQLKALNEGKDLFEVLSLSEPMNPKAQGISGNKDAIILSEEEMAVCMKLGLTAEEFLNGNK